MAAWSIIGYIDSIKYLPNKGGCFIWVSEFKKGFKRKGGEIEKDKYLQWKVVFKQSMAQYISEHFGNGMLVEIKGECLPYSVCRGTIMDGYSVLGQTLNVFSFPRSTVKQEMKMIAESQNASPDQPDLEGFQKDDF